jgi:TRAP-type mannitol/chloroaromatic compound transport system substrate-binding protein
MWFLKGGGDELAAELYEPLNVKYVASIVGTPEIFAHTSKALNTVADMKGLKMRTAGEGGEILAKIGVATVFFPGGEIYESIQRGVIDAFEYGPPDLNWGMGFHEVAPYLYISSIRAPGGAGGFWVNEEAWADLSPDLQEIVETAVRTETMEYYTESVVFDSAALQKYLDYGTNVVSLPQPIVDAFLEAADEYFDEKGAALPFYAEVLESQRSFKSLLDLQGIQ